MALNGVSVLLFVPAASEVLAEIKKNYVHYASPLIIRLELSLNAIENKVYYDLTYITHYIIFHERKTIRQARSYRRSQGDRPPN